MIGGPLMNKRILVAYDGGEMSKQAVEEAKKQTNVVSDTEVNIISVVKPSGPATNANVSKSIGNEVAKQYKHDLELIKKEVEEENIKVNTEVIVGNVEESPGIAISRYAKQNDMDLIIVGSRGLGKVKKLFLDSVSNKVVQNATCPVLVIK